MTSQQASSPTSKLLIQMSGAPGSGKSTVAKLLRPSIGGIVIDHDVLRSAILESGSTSFDQAAKQAYLLQWKLAQDFMKQGVDSIIIDSTCNYPEVLEQGSSLAAQHGYASWYVECKVVDMNLLDQPMRARRPMLSQRFSVDSPPAAAQGNGGRTDEDPRARFARWMESPCRLEDESRVIIVDSTASPETKKAGLDDEN
ncbi:P-loop containing nucleoside triphosphate hydrolase [Fusarium austroafricanum]|uniref:P-loop containing nucleoside triphosphate hydrolase n=1 Tax=Fusarium austroafricanum TaxID=2364996 RepID=A0A8H4KHU3_9HYPO|nr:P-loop containing nucleoside triphosphate hydrolase [Fusarium austroafricanum]